MIVAIPTVAGMLRDEVPVAVIAQGETPAVFELADTQFGYGRLLAALWMAAYRRHTDLVIVEHDIVIPDGCLEGFEHCREDWCAHSYRVAWGGIAETYGGPWGLGCVRYSWELISRETDAVELALTRHEIGGKGAGHWMGLDSAIGQTLRAKRIEAHRHHPDAIHLHEYAADKIGAGVTDG